MEEKPMDVVPGLEGIPENPEQLAPVDDRPAVDEVLRHLPAVNGNPRCQHGGIDLLADAGPFADQEGGQDRV